MAECGFCGDDFENVTAKLIHQENFCEEMPHTKSRANTNTSTED